MRLRVFFALLLTAVLLVASPQRLLAAKTFKLKTTVREFFTEKWTIDCPPRGRIDLTTEALSEQGWIDLLQCIADVEAEAGVHIESKTVVRNGVVDADVIQTETELTEEQAAKLCGIVEQNRIPSLPIGNGRPRIQEISVDSVIDRIILDLGDGCVIDLSRIQVPQQLLMQLFQLLDQFAAESGTRVQSTSSTKGQDRVALVTYLTRDQIQQVKQIFLNNGVLIPPGAKLMPVEMTLQVATPEGKQKVTVSGQAFTRRVPPPPEATANEVAIEMLSLDLAGQTKGGLDVHVGLSTMDPVPGRLVVDPRHGFKVGFTVGMPLDIMIDGLGQWQSDAPAPFAGKAKLRDPRTMRMRVPGKIGFAGGAVKVKVKRAFVQYRGFQVGFQDPPKK